MRLRYRQVVDLRFTCVHNRNHRREMQISVDDLTEPGWKLDTWEGGNPLKRRARHALTAMVEQERELAPPAPRLTGHAGRDQVVEFPTGDSGNSVCGARSEGHAQVCGRSGGLVRLKERNQAGHQLSLSSGSVDLVVILVVLRVVLRDPSVHDAEVSHHSLQAVEQLGAVEANGPLGSRRRRDVRIKS